jgi:(2Fe-2S) ferredoxin
MNTPCTVFVCQHHRSPSEREGCCRARGGAELLAAFQAAVVEAGLQAHVTVRASGCLDRCPDGPVAWVVPGAGRAKPPAGLARLLTRGVAYGRLVPRDVGQILREHLLEGIPVARCRI